MRQQHTAIAEGITKIADIEFVRTRFELYACDMRLFNMLRNWKKERKSVVALDQKVSARSEKERKRERKNAIKSEGWQRWVVKGLMIFWNLFSIFSSILLSSLHSVWFFFMCLLFLRFEWNVFSNALSRCTVKKRNITSSVARYASLPMVWKPKKTRIRQWNAFSVY